ncbi:MAG TPA: cytidine deaminase [Salinivirgaceae bacterium]|nr:cytidine deaminase [Salinivirgaceae bacterium]HQA76364.1 cytidine deaminase [Salinivirgaceae bacterium]
MKTIEIKSIIHEYSSLDELSPESKNLCALALEAAKTAYAPYSKFQVGATIMLENGVVVKGSNQENMAYPSGLCAERVALFYANSTYPDQAVEAIAVTAIHNGSQVDYPISPCGSCRQVIAETKQRFNKKIKILLYSSDKILEINDSDMLLPLSFAIDD